MRRGVQRKARSLVEWLLAAFVVVLLVLGLVFLLTLLLADMKGAVVGTLFG